MTEQEERRAGDWQRKEERKNANDYSSYKEGKKWYNDTFWIVVLLIVFWPVGAFLMWRSAWPLAVKIVISIVLLAVIILALQMNAAVQAMA